MDWLATLLGLIGSYLLGSHNPLGWIIMILNSLLCCLLNYHAGLIGMAAGSLAYATMELFSYMKSRKNKDKWSLCPECNEEHIPNAETIKAMQECINRDLSLKHYRTTEEMFEDLHKDLDEHGDL